MITGRFAILGTENAGKSALLASFPERINRTSNLMVRVRNDCPVIGMAGQDTGFFQDRTFDVYRGDTGIISVQIADYSGGMLRNKPDSSAYMALSDSINRSDVLFILVDGELFCGNSTEDKLRKVKRKCARIITPYISGYSTQNNGLPPKVVFVVTKSRLLFSRSQTTMQEILKILKETFSFAFDSEDRNALQPYTVCVDTSDVDSSVPIPFLTGMYYVLHKYAELLTRKSEADKQHYLAKIADNERVIWKNEEMNIVSRKLRESQTKELRTANAALRNEMYQKEAEFKNHSVWNCQAVIRGTLQDELRNYYRFLVSDYTKGDLDIVLTIETKVQKSKSSGSWNFQKPTGKEIAIAVVFALFNVIGIAGVAVYAQKKNHSVCLIIVGLEFLFCLISGIINLYLIGGLVGGVILLVSGLSNQKE